MFKDAAELYLILTLDQLNFNLLLLNSEWN